MASEQAKALDVECMAAAVVAMEIVAPDSTKWSQADWDSMKEQVARKLAAIFRPPCPQCGAAIKPCIKWVCGSWDEAGARQTSVKCVKRQMAELKSENAELEGHIARYAALPETSVDDLLKIGDRTPPPKPVEPEGQILKESDVPQRTPPDAMT